MYCVHFCI